MTQTLASGQVIRHDATNQSLTLNDKGHVSYWNPRANIKDNPGIAAAEYGGTAVAGAVFGANAPATVFNMGHLFKGPTGW